MNGEQAGAPAPDSQSIEQRIGNIFAKEPPAQQAPPPRRAQAAPVVQEAEATEPDQVPNEVDATSEEQQDAPAPEVTETAPEFEEVEFNGQRYQVPPELKEAIIRQSDYTKKTREVADTRKQLEHQQAQLRIANTNAEFERSIAPQLSEITQIEAQLQQYNNLNWREIAADDRTLYMLEMQRLEKTKAAKESELTAKRQEFTQQLNEQMRKLQSDANTLLKSRIPNWSESVAKEVGQWAISNGFTQEEVSSIYDPRHAEVLWKAAQYDKTRSNAKSAVAQAKVAKPSSANPMPQHVKDNLNFRKTIQKTAPGSAERKAAVEGRIGAIFGKR